MEKGAGALSAVQEVRQMHGIPVIAIATLDDLIGYLAARSVLGLPLSLPTTTGVPHPMPGGERPFRELDLGNQLHAAPLRAYGSHVIDRSAGCRRETFSNS